jgi:hypothetical protein
MRQTLGRTDAYMFPCRCLIEQGEGNQRSVYLVIEFTTSQAMKQ